MVMVVGCTATGAALADCGTYRSRDLRRRILFRRVLISDCGALSSIDDHVEFIVHFFDLLCTQHAVCDLNLTDAANERRDDSFTVTAEFSGPCTLLEE